MKKSLKINSLVLIVIGFSFLFLTGCAGMAQELFNPYDDEFACPFSDPGKCASLRDAYEASLLDEEGKKTVSGQVQAAPCETGDCPPVVSASTASPSSKAVYKERQFETIASLIQEEEPPVVIPPEVVRVLILSYTGDQNEMFGFRYAYFFATDPQWMLTTATLQ
jgi:conjugal transfer pilus assembly protein TraV